MQNSSIRAPAGLAQAESIAKHLNLSGRQLACRLRKSRRPIVVSIAFITVGSLFNLPFLLAISFAPVILLGISCGIARMAGDPKPSHTARDHGQETLQTMTAPQPSDRGRFHAQHVIPRPFDA